MTPQSRQQSGFSLIETLVASAIMLVIAASFAQVFGIAAAANRRAARLTLATLAARQKMEELRSIGQAALAPSSAGAIQADVSGYSERVVGGPTGARFIRRWSIEPLPADSAHLLILEVVVLDTNGEVQARLVTLRRTGSV